MSGSNFNTIYAAESSNRTNAILKGVRALSSRTAELGNPIHVKLVSVEEMKALCQRRQLTMQDVLMMTHTRECIEEQAIMTVVREFAITKISNQPTPPKSTPYQQHDDLRDGRHSENRSQVLESGGYETRNNAPPGQVNVGLINVDDGSGITSSPARIPSGRGAGMGNIATTNDEMIMNYFAHPQKLDEDATRFRKSP